MAQSDIEITENEGAIGENPASKSLSVALGILFLVAINAGLAMLFFNVENGFQWFISFVALSCGVLLLFAVLVNLAAKRALRTRLEKQQAAFESSESNSEPDIEIQ